MLDIRDTEGYVFDPTGVYGPKFHAYHDGELITPVGFPHADQLTYLESTATYTLFGGMRGSGKTLVAVWDALFLAYRVPGAGIIFFRRTLNELRHTVIAEFLTLPEELRGKFTDSLVSPRLVLKNGSVIHFASINTEDAASKYQGRQFLRIIFDEWAQLPWEWWSEVDGSRRWPYVTDPDGVPVFAQTKGLSNPGGPGSDELRYLFGADMPKQRPPRLEIEYDPNDYLFIKSDIDKNPVFAVGTPAGDAYRKNLKNKTPAIRAAWLEGRWDAGHEGMFFDIFEKNKVEIPHDRVLQLMAEQYWAPVMLGVDVGVVHSAVVLWNFVAELQTRDKGKRKFIITFDEMAIKGASERQFAGAILDHMREDDQLCSRISKIYMSPEAFGEASRTRARVVGDVLVAQQVVRPTQAKCEKWSRPNGLSMMYTLLAERSVLLDPLTDDRDPETGGFTGVACDWLISDRCKLLLAAIPWATGDKHVPGDIEKEGNAQQLDVLDAGRYFVFSHPINQTEKPASVQQDEEIRTLIKSPLMFTQRAYGEYLARLKQEQQGQVSKATQWTRDRHRERT